MRKSCAGDAEFGVFTTEISRNVRLDSIITRDLGNVTISICYSLSRYCVFPSEIRECITPE